MHLTKKLEPDGIGIACSCKINANIGQQRRHQRRFRRARELHAAVHFGADTVMTFRPGGNIDGIRQAIIDASPVPIGTVPSTRLRRIEDFST